MNDLIKNANSTQKATLSNDDDVDEEVSTPIFSNALFLSEVDDLRSYVSLLGNSELVLQKLNYIESFVITKASKF